jgi:putative transcriptional regulator
MKNLETAGNEAIRQELGKRLKAERLNQNITQSALAKRAGISRRTLVGAENGEPFTIDTMLSILRELNRLAQIDLFLPEPEISPVQLAKLKGKKRQRAGKKYTYPKPGSTPWVWNEDAE